MWRAYELVEDGEYFESPCWSAEMKKQGLAATELSGPRLLSRTFENDMAPGERMIHIPPGFLSC